MSGDFSRDSFDSLRDFATVLWQQGRPNTDAEWNEMGAIIERRIRAGTVDTIGRAVVPRETPDGFRIRTVDGTGIEIGAGRKYLSGMLFECHGDADFAGGEAGPEPVFDRGDRVDEDGDDTDPLGVLDELTAPRGGRFLGYEAQPYWRVPEPIDPGAGPFLAYLVGWKRHVSAIQEPGLLEPALGGIDTTTRHQHAWQVRLHGGIADGVTCATPDHEIGGDDVDWADLIAPSTARLTTDTIDIEDPEDPCLIPPTDGYTGLENQLYRVELHVVGEAQADARFKFSRENTSVQAAVESFNSPASSVVVQRIGRDDILRFSPGDWVELTDDVRELDHRCGQMLRVAVVNEDTRTIEFEATADADLVPTGAAGDTPVERHTRLVRWDQRGAIRDADGNEIVNVDLAGSDGLIPVPSDGTAVVLESGITVSFSTAEGRGGFRELDHWRFAARTAGTQVERLRAAPPDGVQRHYCRLAIVDFPDSVQDCRVLWPPEPGASAEACGCTVCVTPESHNSGALTIQAAIDQVGDAGGTVCLDGGAYQLTAPVVISGRRGITLQGQGVGTVVTLRGQDDAAIRVEGSIDVQITGISVLAAAATNDRPVGGVSVVNSAAVNLHGLAILVVALGDASGHGVSVDGLALAHRISESLVIAPIALGSRAAAGGLATEPGRVRSLVLAELRVADNVLFGARSAVRVDGVAINIGSARFVGNLVLGDESGMDVGWIEPASGSTAIESSTVISNGDALNVAVNSLRVQDNEISGGADVGDGIHLSPNLLPAADADGQIVGNRIGDLSGAGIRIDRRHGALLIKRNVIRRCGEAGIVTGPDAVTRHLAIDNNVVEEVADGPGREVGGGAMILTQVESGQIVGNRIDGVGVAAGRRGVFAAIALEGVRDVAVESNTISRVGPPTVTAAVAVGVLADRPYTGVIVRANRMIGAPGPNDPVPPVWLAVFIGAVGLGSDGDEEVTTAVAATEAFAASDDARFAGAASLASGQLNFVTVDGTPFAVGAERLVAIERALDRQLTISGNHVRSAGNSASPMVAVIDRTGATVVFTDNQCRLDAPGATAALVGLFAERVIASNNAVRRQSDQDAMIIDVGERGRATVLGNLTFGNIRLLPGGLNPPFSDLNMLAS